MTDLKNVLKNSREQETLNLIRFGVEELEREGFSVEFGTIGVRTTYALLSNKETDTEFVGYTFLKDMRYYNPSLGQLKALQQALARKKIAEESK